MYGTVAALVYRSVVAEKCLASAILGLTPYMIVQLRHLMLCEVLPRRKLVAWVELEHKLSKPWLINGMQQM